MKRVSDEWLESQVKTFESIGADTASALSELKYLRSKDRQASTYVEGPIAMRTKFDGNPPYVGWKGLGLAMEQALDERDAAQKLASWYALLLRAVREWDVSWKREWGGVFVGCGHPSKDRTIPCEFDSEGRPIENAELRAAIEGCLDQPGGEA